ncbi:unnamed protein product [Prorocentrum cordatum]|uniref:Uncharacterized protein n=1 Tax=Prorocentrum cordatum TaxID=2364126 RepID=A0ABN9X4F6_9DINO|nr:unnamed protein product [Polarella glacialis]
MRPLSCAMSILPSAQAEEFLCPGAPSLRPMFSTSHPLLGAINAMERSSELGQVKAMVSTLHNEMMSLRSLGRDDSAVKSQLTAAQQRLEQLKKCGGGDIDVVPFAELDAEVQELCTGSPSLEFAPDSTFVRQAGAEGHSIPAPSRGMQPVWCAGLQRVVGEWPQGAAAAGEEAAAAEEAAPEEERRRSSRGMCPRRSRPTRRSTRRWRRRTPRPSSPFSRPASWLRGTGPMTTRGCRPRLSRCAPAAKC